MSGTKLFLFLCGLLIVLSGISQEKTKQLNSINTHPLLRMSYSYGKVIATNDFLRTANNSEQPITEVSNISADLIFETWGKQDWHQLFNYPKIGVGVNYMWFPETSELGSPLSVYAILEQHLFQGEKSYFDYGFHFGVSIGWNEFNLETNPNNVLIGTDKTAYAHLSLIYHRDFSKRLGIDASLGFSHASNGALKMPNYGINIFDPRISLTYRLSKQKPTYITHDIPDIPSKNEVSLSAAIGTKQFDFNSPDSAINAMFKYKNFTVYNFVLLYQRQISLRSKIGAGIDFTMDPSDNANGLAFGDTAAIYPPPICETAKLALVLSYQLNLGKLALILQPGFYMYRTSHDPTPFFYQRIGVRYDILKNIYLGASLRAVNFGQADWIEFTAGYKINF